MTRRSTMRNPGLSGARAAILALAAVLAAGAGAARADGKTLVVQFLGDGRPIAAEDVPRPELLDGLALFQCFEVDMFDPRRGKRIGVGIDCLSDVAIDPDTGHVSLTDTAFFVFGRKGMVVSQDRVEIRPVDPIADPLAPSGVGQGKTHVTGSFPDADNIIAGTRRFRHTAGTVRLSGAVDMSAIFDSPPALGFDCLFVIDLHDDDEGDDD